MRERGGEVGGERGGSAVEELATTRQCGVEDSGLELQSRQAYMYSREAVEKSVHGSGERETETEAETD